MGDGMHERGSEGHIAPPSPAINGINFSWLLIRSKVGNSNSTPATTSASPSGGGPSGGPPAAS